MDNICRFFTFEQSSGQMQTLKTSKAKEKILSKIRNGLNKASLPMPFPEVDKENINNVFQQGEQTHEENFAEAFSKLGGKFIYCDNEQELLDNIHALYDSMGWQEVVCAEPFLLTLFQNNKMHFVHKADPSNAAADAAITGCEVLVARTGSVLLSSKQHLGRTTSVFYPVHIIVAYANQVVKDIPESIEFLRKKYNGNIPSMINLNTGPSRTADIEKTLVVGVHGPGEVFCFFINA